jgi:hypothetical protein
VRQAEIEGIDGTEPFREHPAASNRAIIAHPLFNTATSRLIASVTCALFQLFMAHL